MIDIFDSMNTRITSHMAPKLEHLVEKFNLNIASEDLVLELTEYIRDIQFKSSLSLRKVDDDDEVFIINIVNKKLYYMDILYGVELQANALKENRTYYDKCTVMCIHLNSKRLINFN